ncbi:MAG TPA: hypothetical protein VJT50_07365 [Pyrinomonadaceae bacterium]|nr:hypothetical protein [Pyrinomonadaceae bacterium]
MRQDYLEIVRQVLDHQVIDANNMPCGKVDDLQLESTARGELKIKSILVGNGPRSDRLPALVRAIMRPVLGKRSVAVPWKEVSVITNRVKLQKTARELQLDESKSRAFKIVSALPGSWKK